MKKMKNIRLAWILVPLLLAVLVVVLIPTPSWAPPLRDRDGDGYTSDLDCNDGNTDIYPSAPELCDGIDNQCPGDPGYGTVDEGCGTADSDGDGILDTTERAGVALPANLMLAETGSNYLPWSGDPAYSAVCSANQNLCVDPNRPDVFLIIKRESPSNLALPPYSPTNPDPLGILRTFATNLGVPVVPHELLESRNTDRLIADGQYAIRVTEHLDTDAGALGDAPTGGTPNTPLPGYGDVDLYTQRIRNEVDRLCRQDVRICDRHDTCGDYAVNYCQNEDGSVRLASSGSLVPLYKEYEQNVLAHEAWHAIGLAPPASPEVALFHYNSNTGWVEEQSIGSKATRDRDGTVTLTLYISHVFHLDSRTFYRLN